jgi:GntR family transcriptional repressor for pyruvate dehydrogenase complex
MFDIKPIGKKNISEEVFEQIEDNIVKQVWPSGSKLPSENQLAEMFQVSRVSVRSAIHKLIALGILQSRNGEGTFVKQLNAGVYLNSLIPALVLAPYDIMHLLEFRRGLEMLSCELAAQRATDEDIKMLGQIVDNMKKSYAEKDIARYSIEDFNFHICISKISKNPVIENVLMILKDPVFSHLSEMNNAFDPNLTTELHYKIFEAIKDHDPKAASFYIEESIKKSMQKIKESYELK